MQNVNVLFVDHYQTFINLVPLSFVNETRQAVSEGGNCCRKGAVWYAMGWLYTGGGLRLCRYLVLSLLVWLWYSCYRIGNVGERPRFGAGWEAQVTCRAERVLVVKLMLSIIFWMIFKLMRGFHQIKSKVNSVKQRSNRIDWSMSGFTFDRVWIWMYKNNSLLY